MSLKAATATRLEKAAHDNGFDRELSRVGDWLAYASSHAPLAVWLRATDGGRLTVALSRADVARGLSDQGMQSSADPPPGAVSCRDVEAIPELGHLLRRAYQLARSLPNELLHVFERKTALMPRTTEAERLVIQRVGQDVFRAGLMEYWDAKCAITGLAIPELLRASHIKPWAVCERDEERLDVFNGLLLAPHLDAAFDGGFLTVDDGGDVLLSAALGASSRALLGLESDLRVQGLAAAHHAYLRWHRQQVFRRDGEP